MLEPVDGHVEDFRRDLIFRFLNKAVWILTCVTTGMDEIAEHPQEMRPITDTPASPSAPFRQQRVLRVKHAPL